MKEKNLFGSIRSPKSQKPKKGTNNIFFLPSKEEKYTKRNETGSSVLFKDGSSNPIVDYIV